MFRSCAAIAAAVALTACGGGAERTADPAGAGGAGEDTARISEDATPSPAADLGGAVLTEIPDPCTYLTSEEATELLGEAAGPGRSADAGGWNCIYDVGEPRRRLVLDMQIARGLEVGGTQLARSLEYCESEIVERFDDLGVDAAVYRRTAERCDDDLTLWVATPAVFDGRPRPEVERPGRFNIHLSVTLSPSYDSAEDTIAVLRGAAGRALERLGG